MRVTIYAFVLAFFAGCSSETREQQQTTAPPDAGMQELHSGKTDAHPPDSLLVKLCRTWYCKRIMLDDLGEEYPTNNEEFLLMPDLRYKAVDRIANDSISGTWLIENGGLLELTEQSGKINRFKLTLLTADTLITKVLDIEDENIRILYTAVE